MSLELFESGQLVHLRSFTTHHRAKWENLKHKAVFLAREVAIHADHFHDLPPWEKTRLRALAAGRACYKAVVVGKSAARLWGMPVLRDDPTTLCLPDSPPPPRSQWFPGTQYRNWKLPHSDITELEGCRVARRSRVIFDVARHGSLADALVLTDHVLHQGLISKPELSQKLERFAGLPGIKKARLAVELADRRSESPLESQARAQCIEAEIPDVQIQVNVLPGIRVDFLIGGFLVAEIDGREKYQSAEDVWEEKKRHDALVNAGFQVIRITNAKLNTFVGNESEFIYDVKSRLELGAVLLRSPSR